MYMYKSFIKRILDVVFSLVLMILLLPLFLIISLLIKLEDGGHVFFKQLRSGKDRDFYMYKFRSMKENNDVHNLKEKDCVTRIGIFLRKTSLDELPQLINILKGEMSFIGPRPWITDYAKYFTSNQMRRLEVLPGITGLAQSSGRNDISIIEKIKLDVEYVDNVSLLMDIKIIFKTISSVFSKKGNNSDKFAIQNELDVLKNQWKNPQHENDKKEETSYKEEVIYN
mgnify:FL=1